MCHFRMVVMSNLQRIPRIFGHFGGIGLQNNQLVHIGSKPHHQRAKFHSDVRKPQHTRQSTRMHTARCGINCENLAKSTSVYSVCLWPLDQLWRKVTGDSEVGRVGTVFTVYKLHPSITRTPTFALIFGCQVPWGQYIHVRALFWKNKVFLNKGGYGMRAATQQQSRVTSPLGCKG